MKRILAILAFILLSAPFAAQAESIEYECICGYAPTFAQCSTVTNEILHTGLKKTSDTPLSPTKECSDACDAKGHSGEQCYVGWLTPDKAAPNSNEAPAAPAGNSGPVKLTNPLKVTSVAELVGNILKAGIGIVGALALLIFIYGGLRWLTSAGEPAKIQAGKDAMKWAAIGLVVIFSSYALVNFVFGALKPS